MRMYVAERRAEIIAKRRSHDENTPAYIPQKPHLLISVASRFTYRTYRYSSSDTGGAWLTDKTLHPTYSYDDTVSYTVPIWTEM